MSNQLYTTSSLGGYYAVPQLTSEIRTIAQPSMQFRKYCRTEPRAGRGRGDTIYFDKNSNASSNGGTIAETSTIPKTNFTITQGSITMTEYGVAIPYTNKLQTLGQISVEAGIREALANSMAKVLDSTAAAQFQASDVKAVVANTATTSITTNSTAATSAGADMSDKNVRDIVDYMKTLNIPKRKESGLYHAICSTNALRGLYDFFEAKAQFTTLEDLRRGIVGTYYGCLFEEETNVLSNVLNSSYGEAVFFGDDAVIEGIVIPEEIRMEVPKDFGRDLSLAWYYLGGFQRIWDYSVDSSERIIHVTST